MAAAARLQRRDGGQRPAFDEFQESAAAGGDVADIAGNVEPGDRRQGIAAAGDRERLRMRDGRGQHLGAAGKLRMLEHTDRAVPDDGAGIGDNPRQLRGAAGADVENAVIGADVINGDLVGAGEGRQCTL